MPKIDHLQRLKDAADELMDSLATERSAREAGDIAAARASQRRAGVLMAGGPLRPWLERQFTKRGVRTAEAEELAQDVWLKLIDRTYHAKTNALGLLHVMAESKYKDHWDRMSTQSRKGMEVSTDDRGADDEGPAVLDVLAAEAGAPPGLVACIRKCFDVFTKDSPTRALLLELVTMGFSRLEMAAVIFSKPQDAISDAEQSAIGDRVYEARLAAKPYFARCQE